MVAINSGVMEERRDIDMAEVGKAGTVQHIPLHIHMTREICYSSTAARQAKEK